MQEDEEEDVPGEADMPANAREAAGEAIASHSADKGLATNENASTGKGPGRLSRIAKGAIFREVVLAKVREMKEQEARAEFEKKASEPVKNTITVHLVMQGDRARLLGKTGSPRLNTAARPPG
ncbi:hypothetical protein IG631_14885 [Alternaria alternata]|nr:hypothetical protein IG631_14885 [Alternaria alternata]